MAPISFGLILFNVFIISILSFFTSWLLIECILFLFRIRSNRLRSFFRMIPFLKLPLDLFLMNWTNWALLHQVYPWFCEKDSRTLGIFWKIPHELFQFMIPEVSIGFYTQEHYSFSLADCLANWIGFPLLDISISIVMGLLIFQTLFRIWQFYRARLEIRSILSHSSPIFRTICNQRLHQLLVQKQIHLLENPHYEGSPFVTGVWHPKIVFPSSFLEILSDEEFEAILSHELAHVRSFDLIWRFLLRILSIVFPWIPSGKLEKLIYQEQELSCDQYHHRFDIPTIVLAEAIYKWVKESRPNRTCTQRICFFSHKNTSQRIRFLLRTAPSKKRTLLSLIFVGIALYLAIGVLMGHLWLL